MSSKHSPPLVLVADDEVAAVHMLRHIFEREGYQVQTANNGITALQIAQTSLPDLILLDIQMPQMNGFEVLRRLREQPITSGIPTIVVSAKAREPSDIAMGLNIGADDYISKPFAPQELLARARSKMKARQLEEALQQRTQELEALLRVSEELNHHLEITELFSLILYLTLDLLQGDFALVGQFDEKGYLASEYTQSRSNDICKDLSAILLRRFQHQIDEYTWDTHQPDDELAACGAVSGMIVPLEHGSNQLGVLAIASANRVYDDDSRQLFRGISRQASLALHNSELYEIQANYANHLEEMVAKRTQELEAAQQMLFRSEKLASIGHLAASIAHEINNPLQPIQLNLEYLLEEVSNGEAPDAKLIKMTQDSVNRISRTVRQLLEFTKTSKDVTFATVDVNSVMDNIIQLNAKSFNHAQLNITNEMEKLPAIQANRDQLEQVFMNMLLNAKAAMKPGGQLTVRGWKTDEKIKIQFSDDGSGIPPELINKIFDPFMTTKPEGSGLGLFVTYGIVESHQGDIEVQSKLNVGTTFTITLPIRHIELETTRS